MINEIQLGLPIYLATVLSVLLVLVDAFTGRNKTIAYYFSLISMILIVISSIYVMYLPQSMLNGLVVENTFSRGMLNFGGFPLIFDILFAIAGLLTIISGRQYLKREFEDYKEFYTLILFSVLGMMMIAHSNHLIMIFIGIEIMSISFYVLSGFIRTRITAVEAALKYFLLGAFASGFLLYGMAMVYGSTQTMYLDAISSKLLSGAFNLTFLKIGLALLIVGLSFKIAAFPFHQWAPDVYQGAPTIVTGFMSTAGKAGALAAFILIGKSMLPVLPKEIINETAVGLQNFINDGQTIIALISAATMLIGNITALVQKNIKRMLAYSSIAHAGYLLIGISSNNANGWSGIIFYSTAYMFMQIGAFIVVSIIEKENTKLDLSDYIGLKKTHPWLASLMAIFMFSLAGIPPFAGFPGKYLLFISAVESGFTWLTIIAVISTIISMYFYIGLIINMFFKEPEGEPLTAQSGSSKYSLAISAIFVILLGIFPGYLIELALNSWIM